MPASASQYLSKPTLQQALKRLFATANHLLKIWFTLKQMGMAEGKPPVLVTTSSPNEALARLFSFGSPNDELFVPFAHTPRFMKMEGDAGRSIVQTSIQRWKTSGSVVTCDPTGFLAIGTNAQEQLLVGPTRSYPLGLGYGKNGFALDDGQRVTIPATAFAAWYYKQTALPSDKSGTALNEYLVSQMQTDLNLSAAELAALFVEDDFGVTTTTRRLTDSDIYSACTSFMGSPGEAVTSVINEDFSDHSLRIRSMKTINDQPQWLKRSPTEVLQEVLKAGAKAVLLYGPPRTGKTRAIEKLYPRSKGTSTTIQIHDGWGYDNLVQGFRPDKSGKWDWESGPLKKAIEGGSKVIVLEEINRTNLTQALGEIFSLIEDAYRGEAHRITLRNGNPFFIPADVVFLMTMNTLDKSTEDIDDAMMGRFAAVDFPPRIEDLGEIISESGIVDPVAGKLRDLYAFILDYYPLGQGYFAGMKKDSPPIPYYASRVRPVLANHFRDYKPENLGLIDNKVESLFGK